MRGETARMRLRRRQSEKGRTDKMHKMPKMKNEK